MSLLKLDFSKCEKKLEKDIYALQTGLWTHNVIEVSKYLHAAIIYGKLSSDLNASNYKYMIVHLLIENI